ncbi:MAG TPA: FAD-binding protein [Dehalococcoidales bacterium]|nr:FAD-binding protein [Dehalococcoidales bacterium]
MPKNSKGREVAEIIRKKCSGCHACIGECPVDAIDIVDSVVFIEPEKCIGCGKCVPVCPTDSILFNKPLKKVSEAVPTKSTSGISEYKGVAVYIEARGNVAADVSWELVGKARELAAKLDTQVYGFVLGQNVANIAHEAVYYGCDKVYLMESPLLQTYFSRVYGKALTQLTNEVKPGIMLVGATSLGRDLASVVATHLKTGLTADCTGLDIDPNEKLLLMTRPTFGGNIMATILCRNHRPQMSTVRPKVMRMPSRDLTRKGEIIEVKFNGKVEEVPRIIETITLDPSSIIDITHSPVLVVIGKGACDSRDFSMFEELAGLLNGTIACSRPLVEAGILPYARQVGQTGKTVAPKLYIGIGVSGAVQHLVGMQSSEKVIAINADRNAAMVKVADYSLVGEYQKVVPELIRGLKARTANFQFQGAK